MLRSHLQFHLFIQAGKKLESGYKSHKQEGSIALLLLVALAVTVGALAIANSSSNSLLRSAFQDQSRNAREAALAGAETIINELNQVQNRRLLVTPRALSTWTNDPTSANINFYQNSRCDPPSPGLPPSPNRPSDEAVGFADGQFRALPGGGNREFRLVSVQKISTKNRANSVTSFSIADGSGTSSNGDYDETALNITDGAAANGENISYIRLTVEGKASPPGGGGVSLARVTREFEVVPKCCGRSFGLPLDPSAPLPPNAAARGVHGKDIRICGASQGGPGELGLVFGINGGKLSDSGYSGRVITLNDAGQEVRIENVVCALPEDGPATDCAGDSTINTKDGSIPKGYSYDNLNFPSEGAYFGNATNAWPWFPETTTPAITTAGVIDKNVTGLKIDTGNQVVQELRNGVWTTTGVSYCGRAPVLANVATGATEVQYHCKIDTIEVGNTDLVVDTANGTLNLYITSKSTKAVDYQGSSAILHERNGVSLQDAGITNCSASANDWVNNLRIYGTPTDVNPPSDITSTQQIALQGTSELTGFFVWAPYSAVEFRGTADFCGRIWANDLTTKGTPVFRVPPSSADDDNKNPALQNKFYDWVARSVSTLRLFSPPPP